MTKRAAKAKRKEKPIRLDLIGRDLAKLLDAKRRMIDNDPDFARATLDDLRNFVRSVREELETDLRRGTLEENMTPEKAQQAIYNCQIFEDSLQADSPEVN